MRTEATAYWVRLRLGLACAALLSATTASALDNTITDDFWDTTSYVNEPAQVVTSSILADSLSTPDFFDVGASVPSVGDVFDSWWTTANWAVLDKEFSSQYGAMIIIFR